MQTYIMNIRPKRQTTIPDELLKHLDLEIGDSLQAEIMDNKIVLTPRKQAALDAFDVIQKAFRVSRIEEKDMQINLRKIRKDLYVKKNRV